MKFFILLFLLPAWALGAGKKIVIGADPFCPFNCTSLDKPGFAIEIAKAIFTPHGYTVSYISLPWPRALEQCKDGKIDAVVGGIETVNGKDPKVLLFPEENVGYLKMVYAGKKENFWNYQSPKDLIGKKFGWVSSYEASFTGPLGEFLRSKINDSSMVDLSSGEQAGELNIKKLIANRINTVIEDETVLRYLKNQENAADQITVYGSLDKRKSKFYVAFSPKNHLSPALIKLWDAELPRMRRDGRLKKILEKYQITDWK